MNIHPLFVHFPIALLVAYSGLELATYVWPSTRRLSWLFSVKAFLLFTGAFAAFAALFTGGIAEDLIKDSARSYILEVHSPVAGVTTLLYLLLAAAYLERISDQKGWSARIVGSNSFLIKILNLKRYLAHLVLDTWFLPVLALIAVIGMVVTGALGAAIVYGPNADPIVSFVYHLFWAQ